MRLPWCQMCRRKAAGPRATRITCRRYQARRRAALSLLNLVCGAARAGAGGGGRGGRGAVCGARPVRRGRRERCGLRRGRPVRAAPRCQRRPRPPRPALGGRLSGSASPRRGPARPCAGPSARATRPARAGPTVAALGKYWRSSPWCSGAAAARASAGAEVDPRPRRPRRCAAPLRPVPGQRPAQAPAGPRHRGHRRRERRRGPRPAGPAVTGWRADQGADCDPAARRGAPSARARPVPPGRPPRCHLPGGRAAASVRRGAQRPPGPQVPRQPRRSAPAALHVQRR